VKTILVVDDEVSIAELIELALSTRGFNVSIAHDGREALEHLVANRPDLVVSDVMMPYVDGVELARTIRDTPVLNTVPVILMSASGRAPSGIENACAAFLSKPFDVDTLLCTVDRVMQSNAGR
jgi:DNA-binding response OmpR family regulator